MGFRINNTEVVHTMATAKKRFPVAVRRALNRAVDTTRAYIAGRVAKDLGVKTAFAKQRIRLERASESDLRARLSISGRGIPLGTLGAKGPVHVQGGAARGWRSRQGVTVKRLSGTKYPVHYPRAFIVDLANGHRGVFRRRGTRRTPITEIRGPSMPEIFDRHSTEGIRRGEASLKKNLASELRFQTEMRGVPA